MKTAKYKIATTELVGITVDTYSHYNQDDYMRCAFGYDEVQEFEEENPDLYPDSDVYDNLLADAAKEVIESELFMLMEECGVINMKSDGVLHSPTSYNYSTDYVNIDVEMNVSKFRKYFLNKIQGWKLNPDIQHFYKQHFHSYSGFYSYCPETIEELENALKQEEFDKYVVGVCISLITNESCADLNSLVEDKLVNMLVEHEIKDFYEAA